MCVIPWCSSSCHPLSGHNVLFFCVQDAAPFAILWVAMVYCVFWMQPPCHTLSGHGVLCAQDAAPFALLWVAMVYCVFWMQPPLPYFEWTWCIVCSGCSLLCHTLSVHDVLCILGAAPFAICWVVMMYCVSRIQPPLPYFECSWCIICSGCSPSCSITVPFTPASCAVWHIINNNHLEPFTWSN